MPEGSNAPDKPALVMEFLNTADLRTYRYRDRVRVPREHLAIPEELTGWLRGHRLIDGSVTATRDDLATAHELRDVLRGALVHHDDVPADRVIGSLPLLVRVTPSGRLGLAPAASGVPGGLATLAAAAAHADAEGTWHRLRMCAAGDCHWIFYDTSRGGAGRWCAMATCGNRDKTRRYRQRRSAG